MFGTTFGDGNDGVELLFQDIAHTKAAGQKRRPVAPSSALL